MAIQGGYSVWTASDVSRVQGVVKPFRKFLLQSLPAVIVRSVATWRSRCGNGGGFSDEIAALRSQ